MQRLFFITLLALSTLTAKSQTELHKDFKFNLNDLTVGQFEQLSTLIGKTKYKDSVQLKTASSITPAQMDGIIGALSYLPYRDVAGLITTLYNSAVKQVEAVSKQEAKKE